MIVFNTEGKEYRGTTALEIVQLLESDSTDCPCRGQSVLQFLQWSLGRIGDRIPPRELDLSARIDDEALALNYLYLCDEYGIGKVSASRRISPSAAENR
jgi:hypothetical protein